MSFCKNQVLRERISEHFECEDSSGTGGVGGEGQGRGGEGMGG